MEHRRRAVDESFRLGLLARIADEGHRPALLDDLIDRLKDDRARNLAVLLGDLRGHCPSCGGAQVGNRRGHPGNDRGHLDARFGAPAALFRALGRDERPSLSVEVGVERHLTGLAAEKALGSDPLAAAHIEQTPMPLCHPFAHDLVEQRRLLQYRPTAVAQEIFPQLGERRCLAEIKEPLAEGDQHLVGRCAVARDHLAFFPKQSPQLFEHGGAAFPGGRVDLLAYDAAR